MLVGPLRLVVSSSLVLATLGVADASLAAPPDVPPSLDIPVAPLPQLPRARPAPAAAPVAPPLVAIDREEPEDKRAPQVEDHHVEPPRAASRVVLVDEPPYKGGTARAVEEAEAHAHHPPRHGRHGRPFHPAPGVVVDVSGAHGGPTDAELQRVARNVGYWPFRHCYEEGLRRDQKLAGSVSFTLGRQAGVVGSQLASASLHDESVALCVMREARALELPWGEGSHEVSATVKVTLSTGDMPVPVPKPVVHADEIRQALRAAWPQVEQCYASELGRRPEAGGRMSLRVRAKATGEILEVSEDAPRFGAVDVTRCVLGVYRSASLPKIHGAHGEDFDYTLHFEAAVAPPVATAAR